MRHDIYYWKCDSPHSLDERQQSFFKEKYDQPYLADAVRKACADAFGHGPDELAPLRVDGNHVNFSFEVDGRSYLFRGDDGTGDDDYMLAESRLMALASTAGVPVPRVHHTDVSQKACPLRFQIMELCPHPNLNAHDRQGILDRPAIARQLGGILRRLHALPVDGFGFVDTDLLRDTGLLRGLHARYADYFNTRLDEHLGYLLEHRLLAEPDVRQIRQVFTDHAPLLDRPQAVLVHRDIALWNLLGTPDRIAAVIDWDDAVGGDPADDFGILRCFYDDSFIDQAMAGYTDAGAAPLPGPNFDRRVWMHTLRNMLWKTKIRHALGYFDKDSDFFLNAHNGGQSLRQRTLDKLHEALIRTRRSRCL